VQNGVTHPPDHLDEFEFLPGVPEAVRRLAEAGYALVVVTNQPDVARGVQSRDSVEEIHDYLRQHLPLLDVLACYHDNGDNCSCRKPKPGMMLEAARRWPLDLARSFLVGDRWSDIVAGQGAGCRTVLVQTPYSGRDRCVPDCCVADLPEAAAWILGLKEE
jgi:D-glycero-D-manno-heptose 1,7-bisphosphate phosphatase